MATTPVHGTRTYLALAFGVIESIESVSSFVARQHSTLYICVSSHDDLLGGLAKT
jgi:hypothetical protein